MKVRFPSTLFERNHLTCLLAAGLLVTASRHGQAEATPGFDWIPPEAMEEGLRADEGEQMILPVTVTPTPKKTADLSKYTKVYTIELAKFGISNDGTNPVETAKGINQALQHVKEIGANRVIFPSGTYMISEQHPIRLDHKDTIIDLNGATLQIQPNGMPKYKLITIVDGAENLRVTNGTLRGDRDAHDYKTEPGTHEWGTGINFGSGNHLEVDHITFEEFAGDGISTDTVQADTRADLLAKIFFSMMKTDLEQGALSEKGEKIPSTEKVRTIKPVDLSKVPGAFELGYTAGYCGFPFIKGRVYQVYFLDGEGRFLEKRKCLQYRTIQMPEGAKSAYFEFNQPDVSDEPAHVGAMKGWLVRIVAFNPPRDVHFHNNLLTRNRRLGIAFTGGQRWLIENNRIENTGGTAPACGVDFEDGAELMQDVVFRKNTFSGNQAGDLVVCAGTELLIEDNVFEKTVSTWGRPHNYIFRNNKFNGGMVIYKTRTGVATIENNHYNNLKLLAVIFDTKAVADGLVRKPGETVSTPPVLLKNETINSVQRVDGTYINFQDSKFTDTKIVAGKDTRLVRLVGCTFEGTMIDFEAKGPELSFFLKNNKGDLPESGPGVNRKVTSSKP